MMTNLKVINQRLENSLKRSEKALTKLQKIGNTTEEGQKLMQRISKENAKEEKWLQELDNECIKGEAKRIGKVVKTHPAAYAMYLERAHRRPGKGRSKTV